MNEASLKDVMHVRVTSSFFDNDSFQAQILDYSLVSLDENQIIIDVEFNQPEEITQDL